jgi:hypothetical protein
MPTEDGHLKERLARQFGAKDTRAWRLFLKRHPNLIASLAPPGEPSVSAGPAEATGSRIAEETPTQLERWLLVWLDKGRLVLARPMGRRSQILSSLTLSNLKTGSAWAGRREMEIVQSWLQRHLSRVARLPASSAPTPSAWQRLLLA